MMPGDKSPESRTYGPGAHYAGHNSIESAVEVALQHIPTMKRIVKPEAWEAYLVLDKGDSGVYAVYQESAWTPQSESLIPYSPPPPGTIVARVEPDGRVS